MVGNLLGNDDRHCRCCHRHHHHRYRQHPGKPFGAYCHSNVIITLVARSDAKNVWMGFNALRCEILFEIKKNIE